MTDNNDPKVSVVREPDGYAELNTTFRVTGAPDPMKMSYGDILFDPDLVKAHYVRQEGGKWEVQKAVVEGPNLKKDGTHGTMRKDRVFYSYSDRTWPGRLEYAPVWLVDAVLGYLDELNEGRA